MIFNKQSFCVCIPVGLFVTWARRRRAGSQLLILSLLLKSQSLASLSPAQVLKKNTQISTNTLSFIPWYCADWPTLSDEVFSVNFQQKAAARGTSARHPAAVRRTPASLTSNPELLSTLSITKLSIQKPYRNKCRVAICAELPTLVLIEILPGHHRKLYLFSF